MLLNINKHVYYGLTLKINTWAKVKLVFKIQPVSNRHAAHCTIIFYLHSVVSKKSCIKGNDAFYDLFPVVQEHTALRWRAVEE